MVRKGAFGRDAAGQWMPARDLHLSPGHPVLVGADADGDGGVLVPAMCLINGTSVRRDAVAAVTYWHVELDAHDILLAEGLAAESYLDWGDRAFFAEASDHALHDPDFLVPGAAAARWRSTARWSRPSGRGSIRCSRRSWLRTAHGREKPTPERFGRPLPVPSTNLRLRQQNDAARRLRSHGRQRLTLVMWAYADTKTAMSANATMARLGVPVRRH